jgi:hypothetical protein
MILFVNNNSGFYFLSNETGQDFDTDFFNAWSGTDWVATTAFNTKYWDANAGEWRIPKVIRRYWNGEWWTIYNLDALGTLIPSNMVVLTPTTAISDYLGISTGEAIDLWYGYLAAVRESAFNSFDYDDNSMTSKAYSIATQNVGYANYNHPGARNPFLGLNLASTASRHNHSTSGHSHGGTVNMTPEHLVVEPRAGGVAEAGSIWFHESFSSTPGFTELVAYLGKKLLFGAATSTPVEDGLSGFSTGITISSNTYNAPTGDSGPSSGWFGGHYNNWTHNHSFNFDPAQVTLNWFTNDNPLIFLEELPAGTLAFFTDTNFPTGWSRWDAISGAADGRVIGSGELGVSGSDSQPTPSSSDASWSTTNTNTRLYSGGGGRYRFREHTHGNMTHDHGGATIDIEPDKLKLIVGVKNA